MRSLATIYRPKSFEDVAGQNIITNILKYNIETNNIPNALLFCGGAGTGKTTCARIFADKITNGAKINVQEINAASQNGVDDIRDMISDCDFQTIGGGYKVYITDECHMFSTAAWNAMLKILEEPPKNIVFILCTTDPQKIPATIMSRVQRFDFKKIPIDVIVERLKYIISEENKNGRGLTVEDAALNYIAKSVNGGMRDAITLLDKCVSYKKNLTTKDVLDITNAVDYDMMIDLITKLKSKETKLALDIIENENRNGKDLKKMVKDILNFLMEIYKYNLSQNIKYTDLPDTLEEKIRNLGNTFYIYCRNILLVFEQLSKDIKNEQYPKGTIECMIIKICEELKL